MQRFENKVVLIDSADPGFDWLFEVRATAAEAKGDVAR